MPPDNNILFKICNKNSLIVSFIFMQKFPLCEKSVIIILKEGGITYVNIAYLERRNPEIIRSD